MARKINYDNWSKEELIKELRRIKETKYGLVWHRDLPEEKIDILINPDARTPSEMFPNEMRGRPFPILKEIKGKEITGDKNKPINLLIEGDNYHSLAVLNFTHQEAINLIYIDPPYNTGNDDFIYNDKIKSNYVKRDDPFRHSKWISFMEKRLKLAKNLLKDTGVIFISIDDNEQAPLKMLCDEIFGPENFITQFIWKKKTSGGQGARFFLDFHEYILCYSKDIDQLKTFTVKRTEQQKKSFKFKDERYQERGGYLLSPLQSWLDYRANLIYPIKMPDGTFIDEIQWTHGKESFEKLKQDGRIEFKKTKSGWTVYKKQYENDKVEGVIPSSIIDHIQTLHGTKELKEIFRGDKIFANPKPTKLIRYLIEMSTINSATILDFFAGSGTTGHAVLEANKEDGGNRQFILCTNDEELNGNGEKIKHKICSDVCYPRLKKVIKGYKSVNGENTAGLGGNLKYYTCGFIEAEPTDRNKRKLVSESTEMLCIRENAFELVQDEGDFKIFKKGDPAGKQASNGAGKYLGIVFYEEAIGDFKKAIKKINGHFNTYVFSLGDDPHEKQFKDIKRKVTLCAIPEVILKVYREIFK